MLFSNSSSTIFPLFLLCFHLIGQVNQAFTGLCIFIEHHIFDGCKPIFGQVSVNHFGSRINDTEIHSLLDGVVEKHGMHGLADIIIATERERKIAYTTTDVSSWKVLLYPTDSFNKIYSIVVVFFNTRSY